MLYLVKNNNDDGTTMIQGRDDRGIQVPENLTLGEVKKN